MSILALENFLKSLSPYPILGTSLIKEDYVPIDLSLHSAALHTVNVSSSNELEVFIWNYMSQHRAKVAFGGYLERRGIYQRSDYFNQNNPEEERNIHIGLDLWIEADTIIFAPLDGEVHSFNNNTNYGDYGPTIILKHSFEGIDFYTLYGHLSIESLENLSVGLKIFKGQQIATLGIANVNGDYPPHLHFQIIKDIQNYKGDYPGVSNPIELEFYKQNCPDPNLLLRLM